MLQSLIAPLVSAEECGRPEEATCETNEPDQACTGRLASGIASSGNSSSSNGVPAAARLRLGLVHRAHKRGLVVHPYSFRNEVSCICKT